MKKIWEILETIRNTFWMRMVANVLLLTGIFFILRYFYQQAI